jgi:hypothetical protein
MAVPEQEKEKSRMSNSNNLHFLFVLEACFQQKSDKDVFQKWEFALHLQIIHQLESETISFLLSQRNGFQPDQLFSLTAFLHTFVYNQYKKTTV